MALRRNTGTYFLAPFLSARNPESRGTRRMAEDVEEGAERNRRERERKKDFSGERGGTHPNCRWARLSVNKSFPFA